MDSAVFTAFVDADGEAAGSGRAVGDGEAAGSGRAVAVCRAAGSGRAVAGGGAAGIGRAVADGGWTGVFDMVTAPAARRRGVARQILAAIGEWATAHDAPRLYLQVEESNHAARGLYESMGFSPLTTYHYRVSPGPATSPPRPAAAPGPG